MIDTEQLGPYRAWLGDFDRRIKLFEEKRPLSNRRAVAVRRKAYDEIDRVKLRALVAYIQQKVVPRFSARDPELKRGPWKYFDLPKYLSRDAEWITSLGLDESPPLKILDLGVGGGHFDFIAKCYGHDPVGIDLFEEAYDEILRVYEIPRIVHRISPEGRLPVEGLFDLITAFQITFNNRESAILRATSEGALWSEVDWKAFLDRLFPLLREGGRIVLVLNKQPIGPDGYHHADRLLRFFSQLGAVVDIKTRCVKFSRPR